MRHPFMEALAERLCRGRCGDISLPVSMLHGEAAEPHRSALGGPRPPWSRHRARDGRAVATRNGLRGREVVRRPHELHRDVAGAALGREGARLLRLSAPCAGSPEPDRADHLDRVDSADVVPPGHPRHPVRHRAARRGARSGSAGAPRCGCGTAPTTRSTCPSARAAPTSRCWTSWPSRPRSGWRGSRAGPREGSTSGPAATRTRNGSAASIRPSIRPPRCSATTASASTRSRSTTPSIACPPLPCSRSGRERCREGFRFVLKAPRRITHDRKLADVDDSVRFLLDASTALGTKRGPLLFQLPPFFKKDVARLGDFLARLGTIPAALEFRHDTWHDHEVYDVLRAAWRSPVPRRHRGGRAAICVATARWGYLRLRRRGLRRCPARDLARADARAGLGRRPSCSSSTRTRARRRRLPRASSSSPARPSPPAPAGLEAGDGARRRGQVLHRRHRRAPLAGHRRGRRTQRAGGVGDRGRRAVPAAGLRSHRAVRTPFRRGRDVRVDADRVRRLHRVHGGVDLLGLRTWSTCRGSSTSWPGTRCSWVALAGSS